MEPNAARRPKRNLAVYEPTHQRISELATGLGVSVADLFERELDKAVEARWRRMMACKLKAKQGAK